MRSDAKSMERRRRLLGRLPKNDRRSMQRHLWSLVGLAILVFASGLVFRIRDGPSADGLGVLSFMVSLSLLILAQVVAGIVARVYPKEGPTDPVRKP